MSKATLTYVLKNKVDGDDAILYLETGTLRYIDYCTKKFLNEEDLKKDPDYKKRIDLFAEQLSDKEDGKIVVSYIEDSDKKEELPILFNDDRTIISSIDLATDETNQIERARHLLWTSKDEMFLKMFLEDLRFSDTTFFNIKLTSIKELEKVLEFGIDPTTIAGENYISIEEVLQYKLESGTKKSMRSLIEDALEVWKEGLFELEAAAQYYYARHLRILENEYEEYIHEKKAVDNLVLDTTKLYEVLSETPSYLLKIPIEGRHTYLSSKQKILDRKETA